MIRVFMVKAALFLMIGMCLCTVSSVAKDELKCASDPLTTNTIDPASKPTNGGGRVVFEAGAIEIAFAPFPQRQAQRLVEKIIDASEISVTIAAYQMTSKPIADALCRAAERGVAVTAVLDKKSNPSGRGHSKRDYLTQCGVAVRTDARYPIMHHKFIVVDDKHVETGSFNYSFAASERNAENAMVIWNNPSLAAKYAKEFDRLFGEAND